MLAARSDVAFFAEVSAIERLAALRIERLLPDGMTQSQFALLSHLAAVGEQTPVAMAAALALSKPTVSNTIQRLAARGFIAEAGDAADGRRKRISITPEGLAALAVATTALRPLMDELRALFPVGVFETALPTLRSLRAWLADG